MRPCARASPPYGLFKLVLVGAGPAIRGLGGIPWDPLGRTVHGPGRRWAGAAVYGSPWAVLPWPHPFPRVPQARPAAFPPRARLRRRRRRPTSWRADRHTRKRRLESARRRPRPPQHLLSHSTAVGRAIARSGPVRRGPARDIGRARPISASAPGVAVRRCVRTACAWPEEGAACAWFSRLGLFSSRLFFAAAAPYFPQGQRATRPRAIEDDPPTGGSDGARARGRRPFCVRP